MKLYATAQLAMLAALGIAGFFLWRYWQGNSVLEIGRDLKEKTPLGIPARTIDSGLSVATGRDETLGGYLAELFDPGTRKVNAIFKSPRVDNVAADYSTPWGDVSP